MAIAKDLVSLYILWEIELVLGSICTNEIFFRNLRKYFHGLCLKLTQSLPMYHYENHRWLVVIVFLCFHNVHVIAPSFSVALVREWNDLLLIGVRHQQFKRKLKLAFFVRFRVGWLLIASPKTDFSQTTSSISSIIIRFVEYFVDNCSRSSEKFHEK